MAIDRVKVDISTGVVGVSAMNWYFSAATAANLSAINTFLTAFKAYIPSGMTYSIPGGGDTLSEVDGKLVGAWSAGAGSNVVGTGSSPYSGQAGLMVKWLTGAVVDGHHPVGRCYLVPLNSAAFATSGGVISTVLTTAQNAASAFLSASSGFIIWHRPVYDRTVKPPALKRPGSTVPALAAKVSATSATLRSRNH